MSEYDDWKQENDRWEAYLYPTGVLRNKLGIKGCEMAQNGTWLRRNAQR